MGKIIKVLDTQFVTITRQQLVDTQRDTVCVICFSEMETGKELPCRHVFHLNCLKRWFEQKQECPMCRMKIVPNEQRPPPPGPIIRQPQLQRPAQVERKESDEDTDTDTETGTGTDTRSASMSMYHQQPYMC